jgi:glycosyltransferase involved in cell wall biosynthesis
MKKISIVTGTYNEAGNIIEFWQRTTATMGQMSQYDYEIIIIDNCSTDSTRIEICDICSIDRKVKAIFNVRNFGPVRSTAHAFSLCRGDATICLTSDLEDPPELIPAFIEKWEQGYKVVFAVSNNTNDHCAMSIARNFFYRLMVNISECKQIPNATGAGLYDKIVVNQIREIDDPYPYIRGLIGELGWPVAQVPFVKPLRKRGVSSYNFMRYFDMALTGIVSHSKLPLRLATLTGCAISFLSFCVGMYYLAMKLLHWDSFQLGLAPAVLGIFLLMGLLFLFLGLIGEYVGLLFTHVVRRPNVVEEKRINFDNI